ncbi:MAG: SGNH/GDSL hydrolase family protein [Clostridia bacterium]|nr:SGNH/GDSL hydrolase family protein [Clostridia bacterium]MBQ9946533.1 SGNH/GDSL hydrolase family protein [Clostridia bacterium]
MKKKAIIIISVILIILISAGGYTANMFGVFSEGNKGQYSEVNEMQTQSILKGKTIIFLGSSVTFGYGSLGESFVDFLEASDGIIPIKEAVSGTTLADLKSSSYVSRMKTIDVSLKADAFICQLSTNDATKKVPLGEISEGFNLSEFDTKTVAGATEYIIAYAKKTWNCPVIFFTQAKYDSAEYEKMTELLYEIKEKWDIEIIDLWNNESINNISEEERKLYLVDSIHPTKAGYRDWWLPEFQSALYKTVR